MDTEGFSDTGMIVFGVALLGLSAVIVVASLAWLLFGRRHRVLGSCGVFFGGALLATPVLVVAAVIASMM